MRATPPGHVRASLERVYGGRGPGMRPEPFRFGLWVSRGRGETVSGPGDHMLRRVVLLTRLLAGRSRAVHVQGYHLGS